jgi:hypothetical protein
VVRKSHPFAEAEKNNCQVFKRIENPTIFLSSGVAEEGLCHMSRNQLQARVPFDAPGRPHASRTLERKNNAKKSAYVTRG